MFAYLDLHVHVWISKSHWLVPYFTGIIRVSSVLYIPIFERQSYIFRYLEDSPIYSYIWKTVLYIPIFQGKQEMLNSYLKQMMLISNMEMCSFP